MRKDFCWFELKMIFWRQRRDLNPQPFNLIHDELDHRTTVWFIISRVFKDKLKFFVLVGIGRVHFNHPETYLVWARANLELSYQSGKRNLILERVNTTKHLGMGGDVGQSLISRRNQFETDSLSFLSISHRLTHLKKHSVKEPAIWKLGVYIALSILKTTLNTFKYCFWTWQLWPIVYKLLPYSHGHQQKHFHRGREAIFSIFHGGGGA